MAVLLLFTTSGFAQEEDLPEADSQDVVNRNELSVNVLNLIIFGALDAGYERILSDYSSLGVDVFAKVFDKNEGEDVDLSRVYAKDFSLTAGLKFFLKEERRAWGFYAEGFGMFSTGVNEKEVEQPDPVFPGQTQTQEVPLNFTDLALGVGIGGKYMAPNGFLLDLSFGLGRNLFHPDSPDIVVLPSVNMGYRF